ncbi:MAG: type I DNA topoisomerase [Clostridia bacterium]|nr:type I DNA topoisomerase [Clostridia bacterium]
MFGESKLKKNNLVIVESPAKAKTIKKYLGPKFDVVASMGHVRDLPRTRLGVNLKENFEPTYSIIKEKKELVKKLKEKASDFENIFLATDPDREGEAIAWHLAYILKLDKNAKNRVFFNEITKFGVETGIKNPQVINNLMVGSQQARRILDRIVGYKLSPFLCQKIQKRLSAGRVQSVALRIINDREQEIENFVPQEYWSLTANLRGGEPKKDFKAIFWGIKDENNNFKQIKLENESQTQEIIKNLENAKYIVLEIKRGKRHKKPAPPFITSTLQQEAARKLNFSSKKTMKVAQELYEGVDIPDLGAVGLITYMRTDSVRISEESRKISEEFILNKWGEKYLPSKKRIFKTKSNAQDAHEAIRPTMPNIAPENIKSSLTSDQFKIYKLIWERFIASQMSDCVQNTVKIKILANNYIFNSSGCTPYFDGFTVLYTESRDEKEEKELALPELSEGSECKLKKLEPGQHFTEPPPRFTEASLVKFLEENGVGRPSTYASIISTILFRNYVTKENKTFVPTELGKAVNNLIKKYFPDIVDIKFTSNMENNLDKVEHGKIDWHKILDNFYKDFEKTLETAKDLTKDLKIKLKENEVDITCDKCGLPMEVKFSRFGKFIGCSGYPECKNIKKFVQGIGVKCHKCGGNIIKKKSKKSKVFYGCENYPKCDFVSWYMPNGEKCPKCGGPLFLKGKKVFCENCEKNSNK